MKDMKQNNDVPADLSRRGFIRRASAGAVAVGGIIGSAAAAPQTSRVQRLAKTKGVDYDVIVLGGGFAGVTAARDSSKNGYKTLLLEARNRLGGRTFTGEFAGHKVDLGGTWIHWTQPFVWAEVQRYNLPVVETPEGQTGHAGLQLRVLVDGRCEVLETMEQLGPVLQAISKYFGDAGTYWERPWDASFRWEEILKGDKLSAADVVQKMDLTPTQRVVVSAYASGFTSTTSDQASHVEACRWWATPGGNMTVVHDSCGRYKFKDGTISLINKMVEDGRFEARLGTPVKSVDDRGDHVVVSTTNGQRITAAAVIVGLPMNVVHNVQFTPALDPLVVEAGREKHAGGSGVKLLIKVKGHLAKGRVSAMASSVHPLPFVASYVIAEDYTILVVFGPDAKRINYADKTAVQTALRDYFPEAVVEDVHLHAWADDPYSKGVWCNYKPGWFEKYVSHFQKDRNRVFFGQGDHGEGWRGFIDGAIGAGMGAANRVKTRLG